MELDNSTISFLTSRSDEMFQAELSEPLEASPVKNTRLRAVKTASGLLNRFVYLTGDNLSQLYKDNLLLQDLMIPTEPNDVTAVIKRSVDELGYLDSLAAMLFDEGVKEESSEGSKKNYIQVLNMHTSYKTADSLMLFCVGLSTEEIISGSSWVKSDRKYKRISLVFRENDLLQFCPV